MGHTMSKEESMRIAGVKWEIEQLLSECFPVSGRILVRGRVVPMRSGDLYYMNQSLHKDHRHSIPIRKGRPGTRISIVFFTKY